MVAFSTRLAPDRRCEAEDPDVAVRDPGTVGAALPSGEQPIRAAEVVGVGRSRPRAQGLLLPHRHDDPAEVLAFYRSQVAVDNSSEARAARMRLRRWPHVSRSFAATCEIAQAVRRAARAPRERPDVPGIRVPALGRKGFPDARGTGRCRAPNRRRLRSSDSRDPASALRRADSPRTLHSSAICGLRAPRTVHRATRGTAELACSALTRPSRR